MKRNHCLIKMNKELMLNFNGKVHLNMVFVASPEQEAEGDRLWRSHASWIKETHHREGAKALMQYLVSKGAPNDGNIVYLVTEVYESEEGLIDHHEQGGTWKNVDSWRKWIGEFKNLVRDATEIKSLW